MVLQKKESGWKREAGRDQIDISSHVIAFIIGYGYNSTRADGHLKKKGLKMNRQKYFKNNKRGMEMVQVAILVGIAVVLGLIFKSETTSFLNDTFDALSESTL